MTEREFVKAEIMSLARSKVEPEPGVGMGLMSLSNPLANAKELFMNIFVSQALDQAVILLEQDKAFIAQAAADYATKCVEVLESGIGRIKSGLSLPPSPGE